MPTKTGYSVRRCSRILIEELECIYTDSDGSVTPEELEAGRVHRIEIRKEQHSNKRHKKQKGANG